MTSWEFSRISQDSCFKEHIRTAASEIIWGNLRDGFLFHRCSRPEILEWLFRKNSRKFSGKNLCWCAFLNFNYQNTLWWIFSWKFSQIFQNSYFKELLRTTASWRFFFPRKKSPESVRKAALKNLRNFWRNSSLGYIYFLILAKKTTPPLMVSWEFCEMF